MTSLDTVDTFASQLCSRKDGVDEAIRVCLNVRFCMYVIFCSAVIYYIVTSCRSR